MNLKRPKIYVDFNELIEDDLVLLSKNDSKKDIDGNLIQMNEGLLIKVYEPDEDENGQPMHIVANGKVEKNRTGRWTICKWNCRIDEDGISYEDVL